MLGKLFRPWRQLPDRSFADVAGSLTRWFRGLGETGAACARSVHDTLRCAERTALCLCFRRAWGWCDQRGRVLSVAMAVRRDASAFPFGEGGIGGDADDG